MADVVRPAFATVTIEETGGADYADGMSDSDVAGFRAQADECRQQAERAVNPLDRESWLRLAGEWTKMAQETEARLQGG
jgi:hypothetical protein